MNISKIREQSFALLRNKYFLASFIFLVWITFFDRNRMQVQLHLSQSVAKLEDDKAHYENEYVRIKDELKTLNGDIEKYAREKYFIKKSDEMVYIIEN